MTESSKQLPLNFKNSTNQTFENFNVGANTAIVDSLKSFPKSSESLFYLWGKSGAGKSHALNAFIASHESSVLIMPSDISKRENVALIGMFDFICIDQTENIAANSLLEESLFFWINEVRQANKKIILASQISNSSDKWQLPDLKSRLNSGRTHQIQALARDEVLHVFHQLANQKGIVLDHKVMKYLQNNCPMNMAYLSDLLIKLDETTLIEKKQVTIPLIKKLL